MLKTAETGSGSFRSIYWYWWNLTELRPQPVILSFARGVVHISLRFGVLSGFRIHFFSLIVRQVGMFFQRETLNKSSVFFIRSVFPVHCVTQGCYSQTNIDVLDEWLPFDFFLQVRAGRRLLIFDEIKLKPVSSGQKTPEKFKWFKIESRA